MTRKTTLAIVCVATCMLASQAAMAQITANVRVVTLSTQSAVEQTTTLPTSQTQFVPGDTIFLELWAQTTLTNGFSSVTADISFNNAVVTAQSITHTALFNVAGLNSGTIDNVTGLIDNLGGSHQAVSPPCSDQVGLSPNWVRVAVVQFQALANGTSTMQSADPNSFIFGTAICNTFGNLPAVNINFGQVGITVAQCFNAGHCDDGLFCNGPEACVTNVCQAGTPPNINDGIACTDDSCDEVNNVVVNTPNDTNCDDLLFCNGVETCSATLDCQAGVPPNINDGIACTDDSCDEVNNVVVNTPNDANCDDLLFCNGVETCSATLDCQAGTPPNINDGIACTDDSCDEVNNVVVNTPNDANCNDTLFCNGVETCSATLDCQAGVPPNINDGIVCTDDSCDEVNNVVVNTPNDANCNDLLFCNGVETCSATLDCQAGTPPCVAVCEHCVDTTDTCDWCIFDLDLTGVIGTGDFALFASCFGSCYAPGDPCLASNFDNDINLCVGTGDYAPYLGCFGDACGACVTCSGPGLAESGGEMPPTDASMPFAASVQAVAVASPTANDVRGRLPRSMSTVAHNATFFIEIWATRPAAGWADSDGLAAVYTNVAYDTSRFTIEAVLPGELFATFAGGEIDSRGGVVAALGGCASPAEASLGGDGRWVRVATLRARAITAGSSVVRLGPTDDVYGISIAGRFSNVNAGDINFGTLGLKVASQRVRSLRASGKR